MAESQQRLQPCPSSPNCVCSDATDSHGIEPLAIAGDPQLMWRDCKTISLNNEVLRSNRLMITTFGWKRRLAYCDSLTTWNLSCGSGDGVIAVRSASRVGYFRFRCKSPPYRENS